MAYVTAAQVKTAVAARMAATESTMPDHLDDLIDEAVEDTYHRMRAILLSRGYSAAQVDGWDRRVAVNRIMSVCYVYKHGGMGKDYSDLFIENVCSRIEKDLEECTLVVDGEIVEPGDDAGDVGHGALDDTNDTFTTDMTW